MAAGQEIDAARERVRAAEERLARVRDVSEDVARVERDIEELKAEIDRYGWNFFALTRRTQADQELMVKKRALKNLQERAEERAAAERELEAARGELAALEAAG